MLTASPAELTALVFDAAVGASRAALRHHEAGDAAASRDRARHAADCVLELRAGLDPEAPGEAAQLAARLGGLYGWAWQRLLAASTGRDPSGISDALATLEPLRDAWRESVLQVAD